MASASNIEVALQRNASQEINEKRKEEGNRIHFINFSLWTKDFLCDEDQSQHLSRVSTCRLIT